eukprot:TRINITY_DN19789_c0_g1_i1.p1 TRINITY_DN19789_c0_g1~~TRINITY_DN19789_c0_g1_i1.p1  ORF type:complete len:165 (+),score=44.51 TRINITY_DN19789_c0_g1_i1:34-495(+)
MAEAALHADAADFSFLEPLFRHLQTGLRQGECEKAEFALDRQEMDHRMGELESRLNYQQNANEMLFRRVEILEQVLQVERTKRQALQGRQAAAETSSSATASLPGKQALEDCLRTRKVSMPARVVLQSYCFAELEDGDTRHWQREPFDPLAQL